jgi:hypothetical protein
MNKRQKKKFVKKNMIKLKKIHPDEGDVVILQFDPGNEYMSIDTVLEFYEAWEDTGIFDRYGTAIVPCNVKVLTKEAAQKYCDALQELINKMER